jgi:hypothetical protein
MRRRDPHTYAFVGSATARELIVSALGSRLMKIAIWGVFVIVALLWTGGAALLAQLVEWSAQGLAAGGAASIGTLVERASPPGWLSPWIDAVNWAAAQDAVGRALTSLSGVLPAIGDAVAWLVPAVWVLWGLGLLALIGLTVLATSLLGRFARGLASGRQAA